VTGHAVRRKIRNAFKFDIENAQQVTKGIVRVGHMNSNPVPKQIVQVKHVVKHVKEMQI
jgi:aspartate aminotransferase-like enzyme